MNDTRFDAKLVAATKRSDSTNTFVQATMRKIRILHAENSTGAAPKWFTFLRHKVAFGVVAAVVMSIITFTGYAYAIGSDPISLIKRWVVGDTVKIEYKGRHFEHGKNHAYSDAAVTAFAEINTVTDLYFRAQNGLQTPNGGVEYVSLPASMNPAETYQNPYFATITSVTADSVTLHKKYMWGNKMLTSQDLDETMTVPRVNFRHFVAGEPAAPEQDQLVMVFPDTSIRHEIAVNQSIKVVTYFSFAFSHDLAAIKEASYTGYPTTQAEQVLFEPSWGGVDARCLNNGADECDIHRFSKQENDGLYPGTSESRMNAYNPAGSWFMNDSDRSDAVPRNIMGNIVKLDTTGITVKTSSGAEWKIGYSQRAAFKQHYGAELRIGDTLVGQIAQSIYELNSRTVDNAHVISLERIK
jgi:hypothetical protein